MTSNKVYRFSFLIVTTLAITSTPFVHGVLGLPMKLHPLPDPFAKIPDPNTAQELQLAIEQTRILPTYQSQLDYAKKLKADAEAKGQTKLTQHEQDTNEKRIESVEFTINKLLTQIKKCNDTMEQNQAIIEKGMKVTDDPTTNDVVEAMRKLAEKEKEYADEQSTEKPNAQTLNTLSDQIQKNRQIILNGLRKGIYPRSRSSSNMLLTATETDNELVTQYLLKKYPKHWTYQPKLLKQALGKKSDHVGIAKMLLQAYKLNYHQNNCGIYTSWNMRLMHDVNSYTDGKTLEIIMSGFHIDPNELLESCLLGNNFTFLKEILTAGADANRKNSCGKTPLQRIIRYRDSTSTKKILNKLLAAGATKEINDADQFGKTTLDSLIDDTVINNNNEDDLKEDDLIDCALILLDAGAIIREAPYRTYSRTEQAFINAVLEKRRKTTTPPKNKTTMLSIFMRIVSLFK